MSTQADIYKIYLSNFLTGLVFWYGIEQLFKLSIGIDPVAQGVLVAFLSIFNLVFDIPSGMLADRWSRKKLLMVSATTLACASVVCGMSTSLGMYLVGTALYGIYIVSTSGTYQAMMYDTLHELGRSHEYSKINGRAYGLFLVGAGIGNIASGFIATAWGYRAAFFLTVVSCVANVILMSTMHEPRYHKDAAREKFLHQAGKATLLIVRTKLLAVLVMMAAMLTVISLYCLDFGQLYMSHYVAHVQVIGILWAIYAFALAAGSFVAHYFYRHVWAAVALSTVPIVGMMMIDQVWSIAFIFIQAIGSSILFNQIETRVQDRTPSQVRATILSVISDAGRLVAVPVSIAIGWMITHQGVRPALLIPVIAAGLVITLSLLVGRHMYVKYSMRADA